MIGPCSGEIGSLRGLLLRYTRNLFQILTGIELSTRNGIISLFSTRVVLIFLKRQLIRMNLMNTDTFGVEAVRLTNGLTTILLMKSMATQFILPQIQSPRKLFQTNSITSKNFGEIGLMRNNRLFFQLRSQTQREKFTMSIQINA
jgi:hypothetical protein